MLINRAKELTGVDIDSSWNDFFTTDILSSLEHIYSQVFGNNDVTPVRELILRFLSLNLNDAKVVIIGQDPYPQKGVATGRAFEVGGLNSWHTPFRNSSLRSILRSLYYAYSGERLTFKEVKAITPMYFNVLPPNSIFKYWEKQGVLLLNTSFSCKIGSPASHATIWKSFTSKLLLYINIKKPDIYWFLWGNHARDAVKHFTATNVIINCHPMICQMREDDFLYGSRNAFKETEKLIDWIGIDS